MIRGTIDRAMHHDPAEALLAALLPILFGDPLPELVGVRRRRRLVRLAAVGPD